MSLFEYVAVIVSMILALAVGQLLLGAAGLAKNRKRVSGYLAHTLWMVLLFLFAVNLWWSQWDLRDIDWTFPSFFYVICSPTLLFFAVAILLPDDPGGRDVDLDAHFFAVRPIFLSIMLTFLITAWFDGPILQGQPVLGRVGQLSLVYVVAILWGLATESRRVHLVLSAALVSVFSLFVVVRFLPGAGG